MERQSGKEGESILFPSGAKGNSIRPVIEPFFTSFHMSLLYNPSPFPLSSFLFKDGTASCLLFLSPGKHCLFLLTLLLFLCNVFCQSLLSYSLPSFFTLPYDVNKTEHAYCALKRIKKCSKM